LAIEWGQSAKGSKMSSRNKRDLGFDDESLKKLMEAYKPEINPAPDNLFSDESLRMLLEQMSKPVRDDWLSDDSVKNLREELSSSDSEFSDATWSESALSALLQIAEIEEPMPQPNPNLTSRDAAAWMLLQVKKNGTLYQCHAAKHIRSYFGKRFIYLNENSNPAISREVLKDFLAISLETVVWSRRKRYWRRRRVGDKPKQRMVDE
jgi:hypothetical protein